MKSYFAPSIADTQKKKIRCYPIYFVPLPASKFIWQIGRAMGQQRRMRHPVNTGRWQQIDDSLQQFAGRRTKKIVPSLPSINYAPRKRTKTKIECHCTYLPTTPLPTSSILFRTPFCPSPMSPSPTQLNQELKPFCSHVHFHLSQWLHYS